DGRLPNRRDPEARTWPISRFAQHLELIFPDLDELPWLLRHEDPVDPGALRAERPAVFHHLRSVVAGVEDLDDGAVLQRFDQVRGGHRRTPSIPSWRHQGAPPMVRSSSAYMIPASDAASPSQDALQP